MTIHLCGLPGSVGRAAPFLLGLASGGVCRATRIASCAGALLPHRCTLTCDRLPNPSAVSLCCTVRQVAPTWLSPAPCPSKSRLSSTQSILRRGHPDDSSSFKSLGSHTRCRTGSTSRTTRSRQGITVSPRDRFDRVELSRTCSRRRRCSRRAFATPSSNVPRRHQVHRR